MAFSTGGAFKTGAEERTASPDKATVGSSVVDTTGVDIVVVEFVSIGFSSSRGRLGNFLAVLLSRGVPADDEACCGERTVEVFTKVFTAGKAGLV